MAEYKILGRDAYGNPMVETVQIEDVPLWKRAFRRVARFFGYGRWKTIKSISVK
jgi:hypothetical protein